MNKGPRVFRAIQEDSAAFVTDWPVFGDTSPTSDAFGGQVFVLNRDGAAVSQARRSAPTDRAADAALASIGWTRQDCWTPDTNGRRTAVVAPSPASIAIDCVLTGLASSGTTTTRHRARLAIERAE
jgi:hypothetical protein